MESINKYKNFAPSIVRFGISFVFLWFGINQLLFPENFIGYIPMWSLALFNVNTIILFNGIFQTLFGLFLVLGLFTRVSSLLLGLHLIIIIFSLGYNDIAIRDFGILIVTVSIFLNGVDNLCLDKKVKNYLVKNRFIKVLYLFN